MNKAKSLWIFSGILLFINIIVYVFRIGGEQFLTVFSDSLPVICGFISVLCVLKAFMAFRRTDYSKIAWFMIFLGITMEFIAELIYSILEIGYKMDMNVNYPSIADYFWCGGYVPLFIGLAMMLWSYKNSGFPMGSAKLYLIMVVILLIFIPLVSWYLFLPILHDTETDTLSKFFYLFYPIADIMVVIPAIILMYITSLFGSGSISRPWKYLSIGFICFTLADLIFSYLSWQGMYGSGNLIDLAWHAGYLLVGIAGLYQFSLIKSFEKESTK